MLMYGYIEPKGCFHLPALGMVLDSGPGGVLWVFRRLPFGWAHRSCIFQAICIAGPADASALLEGEVGRWGEGGWGVPDGRS